MAKKLLRGVLVDVENETVGIVEIEDGNLTSFTEDEAQHILRLVKKIPTRKHPDGYPMLTQCEF